MRKFSAGDGFIHQGGYTKIFIMHFYAQNAVPVGYTRAETEDCKKKFFLQPKMGVIHQALYPNSTEQPKIRDTYGCIGQIRLKIRNAPCFTTFHVISI